MRLEWGPRGAAELSGCRTIVIVDVLSFGTAVDIGVSRGAVIYPAAGFDQEDRLEGDVVVASPWRVGTVDHPYSLSPSTLTSIPAGTRLVLPSPNGASIAAALANHPRVFAGSLRNARAVALAAAAEPPVAVIAAGEQWDHGGPRWALEDYLGAGAILARLPDALLGSPESSAAELAAQNLDIAQAIRTTASARELVEWGFPQDVDLAVDIDVSATVPALVNGGFRAAAG